MRVARYGSSERGPLILIVALAHLPALCLRCWSNADRPVLQGLFHPARKVREVYWKIYNNLYIGAQDALVSAYPRLDDDGINTYSRGELDVFI